MSYLLIAYGLGIGAVLLYGLHLARERRTLRESLRSLGTANPG